MTHFDIHDLNVECARCVVCEKDILGDHWFARVKHGEWTVLLCSQPCAKAFYAQQLPAFRWFALLAAHSSLKWPRAKTAFEKLAATP